MGSIVTAYRSFDEQEILQVIANPAIVKTISEDGGSLSIDPNASCFIACKVDGELASVWIFHKVGAIELDVHAHVLPSHRQHSKAIGQEVLKEILSIAPWASKYTAQIPHKHPNVYRYAKQFGFIGEGINRKSYLSDGQVYDQWRIGALKEEILNVLD